MIRKTAITILILAIFVSVAIGQNAETILQKVSAKLLSLQTIKYIYHQEYNYKSEAYFAESRAESFLDFTDTDNAIGLKFQFENENSRITYNGSEVFSLNKKDKTIVVEAKPSGEKLSYSSYLQFALPAWRNILPKIIADKSIVKTIKDTGTDNYVIEFAIDKSFIESGLGTKILPMTIDRQSVYRLTIDKKSFLPVEVYRGTNVNQDFNKATFSGIVENPASPFENSWYYSTYLNEYKYAQKTEENLIKTGEAAREMRLPKFGTNKTVSLEDYKGKVIMLEFWIFHCGYCQAAVPKLNKLQEDFKGKNLQILAVNIADSEKQIQLFIDKLKPEFPILFQGESVAKEYGVFFYPTIILIGKDGKIIYSGSFDEEKISELIKQNL